MYNNSKVAKAIRLAMMFGAGAAAAISAPTFAAEEGADEVEKIQVTGSRIKRADMETSSPMSVTSAEDIKVSGFTRVEDMLNTLPQIEASSTAFEANGATGRGGLDLRGLGSHRTLVLVNGRRMQPGGGSSGSADVNSIPGALVKRVEVMTGGGASVYGSDAIAGVVNFVMDTDFEGIRIDVIAGGYQHNNDNKYIQGLMDKRDFEYETGQSDIEGKNYGLEITMGGDFADGKGHATSYATWKRNDEMKFGTRDYTSCALNATGTGCGGSGNAVVPNFYLSPVGADGHFDWDNYEYLTLTPDSNFTPSVGNVYNYNPVNFFMRPDERFSLGSFVNYEINDHVQPYMEFMYMRDQTKGQIAESGTFFNEEYNIDYDSPLISDAQRQYMTDAFGIMPGEEFSTYIGKRNVEGGARASIIQHDSFRIVLGSEGEINDNWTYDTSIQVGSTTVGTQYINDFFAPRITTALSANGESCADTTDCVPYEVFAYQGITPDAASTLTGVAAQAQYSDQFIFSAYVTGEIDVTSPFADTPIAVVIGTEYRKEDYERVVDEVYDKGLLLGQGGPTHALSGGYSVRELYGEASIPLVEDAEFAESLIMEVGYRYSDYSTTGDEPTYKIAFDWTPMDDWKVRASYNRAARAPNIGEMFANQGLGLWTGTDPCATATPEFSQEQCANTGVTAAQYGNVVKSPAGQYNGLYGGNPDLSPEIADTLTLGLVGQITDEIDFSIDYWTIDIEEVIGTIDEDVTLEQCANSGDAAYCDNITRNNAGSLWTGQQGFITATNINLASRAWEGIDVTAGYNTDLFGNSFSATFMGTQMLTKEYEPLPGDPDAIYDCAGSISAKCFPQPSWRHVVNVNYDLDDWGFNAKWRYNSSVSNDDWKLDDSGVPKAGNDLLVREDLGSESYIDLSVRYTVNENLVTRLGVNNVLDREPPMTGNTMDPGAFYDQLGRYIHMSVSLNF
ncbi:TonB-dependent receptor domain-containing protein [Colwellia psychrerythraea]|uniref:TonB-dependent receptor n=1 Tax=Colwellia psychrerythraea TaxID=28229 RepID=A0A099L2D8_COLPS|nr:TonB-dependent receptor [Colwellia psychrerythraea]KGJ96327.1 TonB-dependent receptor [Colwellia psychrerythraea]